MLEIGRGCLGASDPKKSTPTSFSIHTLVIHKVNVRSQGQHLRTFAFRRYSMFEAVSAIHPPLHVINPQFFASKNINPNWENLRKICFFHIDEFGCKKRWLLKPFMSFEKKTPTNQKTCTRKNVYIF